MWDPIGVKGIPQCRDEYSSYVHVVVAKLPNMDENSLQDFLVALEKNAMEIHRDGFYSAKLSAGMIMDWYRSYCFVK